MSEWHSSFFGDLVVHQKGFAFKSSEYESQGHPVIRVSNFTERSIDMTDCNYINPKNVNQYSEFSLCKGDVVIATVGSWANNPASVVGKAIYVPSEAQNALLNQNAVRLRATNQLDQRFMFYLLKTEDFQNYIVGTAQGSANQASITLKDIFSFSFDCPPLPEQRAIAHILGTLDDKIELNRQMNETLEAMARAIFKSWFVDFDPVRAKAEGRDTGLPEEIAELFPDSFEETEMGEVPKGWKYCSAETVADVGIGKTPPRKESEWFSTNPDDIRWASIRDMGESGTYILDTTEYLTSEAVDKFNIRLVPNNTVLLSFKLTIGRVTLTDGEITTNEAIAHFKLYDEFHLSNEYLYLYLQKFDYTKLGSTSSIAQAVNSKTIKAMPILVPEESVITEFTGRFVSIFDKIKMNQRESRTLAELRDTLLPKLISGELRVNDLKINMEAMQ